MKKLVVAGIAVAIGFAAQAASWSWATGGKASSQVWYDAAGNTAAGMTVYLFDADVISADDLLTAVRGGDAITDYSSVKSATLSSEGKLAATSFTYGTTGSSYSYYMALVDGDNLFLSTTIADQVAQLSDTVTLTWSGVKTMTTTSMGEAAYAGSAGWYTTSVPEPTSGLLMLIGVAGLALRRRRA